MAYGNIHIVYQSIWHLEMQKTMEHGRLKFTPRTGTSATFQPYQFWTQYPPNAENHRSLTSHWSRAQGSNEDGPARLLLAMPWKGMKSSGPEWDCRKPQWLLLNPCLALSCFSFFLPHGLQGIRLNYYIRFILLLYFSDNYISCIAPCYAKRGTSITATTTPTPHTKNKHQWQQKQRHQQQSTAAMAASKNTVLNSLRQYVSPKITFCEQRLSCLSLFCLILGCFISITSVYFASQSAREGGIWKVEMLDLDQPINQLFPHSAFQGPWNDGFYKFYEFPTNKSHPQSDGKGYYVCYSSHWLSESHWLPGLRHFAPAFSVQLSPTRSGTWKSIVPTFPCTSPGTWHLKIWQLRVIRSYLQRSKSLYEPLQSRTYSVQWSHFPDHSRSTWCRESPVKLQDLRKKGWTAFS